MSGNIKIREIATHFPGRRFLISYYVVILFLLMQYGFPVLTDSDDRLHLALIKKQYHSSNYSYFYLSAPYHIFLSFFYEISGGNVQAVKTQFSVLFTLMMIGASNCCRLRKMLVLFIPLIACFSLTLMRDDWLLIFLFTSYALWHAGWRKTSQILVAALIALRPTSGAVLLMLEAKKQHNRKYKIMMGAGAAAFAFLLVYFTISKGYDLSLINIVRAFVGPLHFAEHTIYGQYYPLEISYRFFQVGLVVYLLIILAGIRKSQLVQLMYAVFFVSVLLYPYTLFDALVGPRQSMYLIAMTGIWLLISTHRYKK